MSELSILSPLADEPELLAELDQPIRRQLLDPARTIGEELKIIGITPIPSRPLIQRTLQGTWIFAADYLADPGLGQDGAIAVPEAELHRLYALRDAGIAPDLIWIGHELPSTWRPKQPLPAIVPDARRYRQLDQQLERLVSTAITTSLRVVRGTGRAGAALGTLGLGLAEAIGSGLAELDPVVLGGVRHRQQPVAAWAVLAQWRWT
jgi:hypothetical protein